MSSTVAKENQYAVAHAIALFLPQFIGSLGTRDAAGPLE